MSGVIGPCSRCRGRFVPWPAPPEWKCAACGEVLDPVIVANRARQARPPRDVEPVRLRRPLRLDPQGVWVLRWRLLRRGVAEDRLAELPARELLSLALQTLGTRLGGGPYA